jgi:hypothetical protein
MIDIHAGGAASQIVCGRNVMALEILASAGRMVSRAACGCGLIGTANCMRVELQLQANILERDEREVEFTAIQSCLEQKPSYSS